MSDNGGLVLAATTTAMVVGIFQTASPGIANVRVSDANDKDLAGSEKSAAWLATALVSGVSLIAREPLVFIMGGSMVVALSWWHRHANSLDPQLESLKRRMPVDTVPIPGSPGSDARDNAPSEEMADTTYDGIF